jgi:hypothetical protein
MVIVLPAWIAPGQRLKHGAIILLVPFWFGVISSFNCPSCNRRSAEKMALCADSSDEEKIQLAINSHKMICQLCGAYFPDGVEMIVYVQHGSLQHLRGRGYPVPQAEKVA